MDLSRSSGLLLHITSLPGNRGIGTLGEEARRFADFTASAGFSYWQILPLGPTTSVFGHSPYASYSTFAGNPLLISLEDLAAEEWFHSELPKVMREPDHRVDFHAVEADSEEVLRRAWKNFTAHAGEAKREDFKLFRRSNRAWLDDYTLFTVLAEREGTLNWREWPPGLRSRRSAEIREARQRLADELEYHAFVQYIFFRQWDRLHEYCRERGIGLIGDIPIYISFESADAWANREILQVGQKTGEPSFVAGVPPDYFSETGQRWGNPLYRWFNRTGMLKRATLNWWKRRIAHLTGLVDIVRVDHFRAFAGYWSIPASEPTAIKGKWIQGPGLPFFKKVLRDLGDLPLIAEDLGVITPDVDELRDRLGLPGMKILQFAFDGNSDNYYLPHSLENPNCIYYTGTHDNNTLNGWYYGNEISDDTRRYIREYLGLDQDNAMHWRMLKVVLRSTARLSVVPVQDIIGFGEGDRMNTPGTSEGNWIWRLEEGDLRDDLAAALKEQNRIYRR